MIPSKSNKIINSLHIGWFFIQAYNWRCQKGGLLPDTKDVEQKIRNTISFFNHTQNLN